MTRWVNWCAVVAASVAVCIAAMGMVTAGARASIPRWQHYVEAPTTDQVSPVRVIEVTGDVTNPQALTRPTGLPGSTGPGTAGTTGGGTASTTGTDVTSTTSTTGAASTTGTTTTTGTTGATSTTGTTGTASTGGTTTLTYTPGGPAPRLVLDFGKEVGGNPNFVVTAAAGLPTLKAAFSETLAHLGPSGDLALTPDIIQSGDLARSDQYVVSGPEAISDPDIQGGERYESITLTSLGSVTLSAAGIHFTGVLGTPANLRGWFRSSDDLLNRIWYAGVYTLNLVQLPPGTKGDLPGEVNNADLITDGAKRDRLVWSGDLLADGPSVFDALDPTYIRDSLAEIGADPATTAGLLNPAVGVMSMPGPLGGVCAPYTSLPACLTWSASYSLVFVPALYEYYLYTGDAAFVRQEWPAVTRELAWNAQQLNKQGLFATNALDGFDWNVEDPTGALTYDNALDVMALDAGAQLAGALDEPQAAAGYTRQAQTLSRTINTDLWNPRLGAYGASTSEPGALVQDANTVAALSGVASAGQARQALTAIATKLATPYGTRDTQLPAPSGYTPIVSPYMGGFELDADFQAGLTNLALAQLRTEWGWMVNHDPGGTDWEKIELNGTLTAMDSAVHGWSTGPTGALTQYLLGVLPTGPGFTSFDLAPHPGDVRWAQGSVPTPYGDIHVSWVHTGRRFTLTATTPRNLIPTITLPVLSPHQRSSCLRSGPGGTLKLRCVVRPAPRAKARR